MSYPETMSEISGYPKALSHAESGGGGDSNVNVLTVEIKNNLPEILYIEGAIKDGMAIIDEIAPETKKAISYIEPDTSDSRYWLYVYSENSGFYYDGTGDPHVSWYGDGFLGLYSDTPTEGGQIAFSASGDTQ